MQLQRPYFSNLDGIRALACLMVFVAHSWDYLNNREIMHPLESWVYNNFIDGLGTIGVSLFFVLSGFLITSLLLHEKEVKNTISLKQFYIRRILRIWPLFFFVVVLGFFVVPLLSGTFNASEVGKHIPWYLLFINNFDLIFTGFTGFKNDSLGVLWSVAVEEQFYLFWPLLLLFIRKTWFIIIPILLVLITIIFRYSYASNHDMLTYHTFSVMGDLAIGSAIAWRYHNRPGQYATGLRSLGYLFLVGIFLFHNFLLSNGENAAWNRLLIAFAFGFLIDDQVRHPSGAFRFSSAKWLSKFGSITYGFYCLHLFVIMGLQKLNVVFELHTLTTVVFLAEVFAAFIITTGIAWLSYKAFEQPLLQLRHRFNPLSKAD